MSSKEFLTAPRLHDDDDRKVRREKQKRKTHLAGGIAMGSLERDSGVLHPLRSL